MLDFQVNTYANECISQPTYRKAHSPRYSINLHVQVGQQPLKVVCDALLD